MSIYTFKIPKNKAGAQHQKVENETGVANSPSTI
jgi:hypothetical protein